MNEHDATEVAYNNGYKQGMVDTVRKMRDLIEERCINGGIYPALVKNTISKVAEEMLEGTT